MYNTRLHRFLLSFLGCFLILLLVACGSGSPPATGSGTPGSTTTGASGTVAPGHTPGVTPPTGGGITPVATTVPVPPTQTSCPAAGTARAAVTAPLALGNHPNIVYIVTQFTGSNSTSTLKRYDVSTGNKTVIITLTNTSIFEAQVSADGQWILFVALANASSQRMLQMIRMDGQGLQTLYCGSNVTNVQWSSNQQLVAFNTAIGNNAGTYLLNMTSGNLQLELKANNRDHHLMHRIMLFRSRGSIIRASMSLSARSQSHLSICLACLTPVKARISSLVTSQPFFNSKSARHLTIPASMQIAAMMAQRSSSVNAVASPRPIVAEAAH